MGFKSTFETEPDFVNEIGVKWWHDDSTTHYAQKPDSHGTTLDAVCFYVEEPSGHRTRVLISKAGEIIEEAQSLEALALKIDVRKFLKRAHEKTPNDRVEGRDAALSRRVPSHDGLGGADLRRTT